MLTIQSFILSTLLSLFHPFYVSVVDVNHNVKDKNVEISVRIFVDDFENILKKNNKRNIDLNKSTNDVEVNKLVQYYVESKLQISLDNKMQTMHYLGYEVQKESAWIFLEINNIKSFKKINFNCNILYDYQTKQMNIINVKANGGEKNYKLDYPKNTLAFEW